MQTTSIAWADYSFNPVTGCTRAGPECFDAQNDEVVCYAEAMFKQQAQREHPPEYVTGVDWTAENADEVVTLHEDRLDEPFEYRWPEGPGRVFVCSMSDLFHEQVPDSFIRRVVALARQFPEHVWIFLTKRPERAAAFDPGSWPENIWLGTSVGSGPGGEYPDTTHRIDALRDAGAHTLWVSFEPLIEPIGDVDLSGFDWAVAGGESRKKDATRRDMEHEWVRDLRQQCAAQGVEFFFKQSSGRYPETGTALTVERTFGDTTVYEQREVREFPDLPVATRVAREQVANQQLEEA